MPKHREFRPLRVDVEDNALMELHERLSKRQCATKVVAQELIERERERPRCNGKFVQVPLPAPTGNKAVLCLYLRLWKHLRSPSWKAPRHFQPDADMATMDRCRAHILRRLGEHRHKPVLGSEWTSYLSRGAGALKEAQWITSARNEFAERFSHY